MNDLGVIDHFLAVFSRYIDSGFGLLGPEVRYLTATLVALDLTLAGLYWAMGGHEDVIARLIKKTLYIGTFAFILTNFNLLASVLFRSFASLGLTAGGGRVSAADFLHPGRLAAIGVDAGHPILAQIGDLTGFPGVFLNLDSIVVLFLAWLIVIVSFFVLAVQLFVTLIEFKLTTLAGFLLVPFALWQRTAFLAERVLGNVVCSGIKVLVLAVIVGIGSAIFGDFHSAIGAEPSVDQALAIMLASLALLGLGIFGPGIATGLVAGGPQLGAGAAAATALGVAGLGVAAAAATTAGVGLASRGTRAVRAATSTTSRERGATREASGATATNPSMDSGVASPTASAGAREPMPSASRSSSDSATPPPARAQRLQRRQRVAHGVATATQVVRSADHGAAGASPRLGEGASS